MKMFWIYFTVCLLVITSSYYFQSTVNEARAAVPVGLHQVFDTNCQYVYDLAISAATPGSNCTNPPYGPYTVHTIGVYIDGTLIAVGTLYWYTNSDDGCYCLSGNQWGSIGKSVGQCGGSWHITFQKIGCGGPCMSCYTGENPAAFF